MIDSILQEHQRDAMRYALRVQHPALFMEQRTRKTRITVLRCTAYVNCFSFLIVAPQSAWKSWQDELDLVNRKAIELSGTRQERRDLLRERSQYGGWYIVNWEGLYVIPEIKFELWDVLILDESRIIANPRNALSKFCVGNFRTVQHRWLLTGTPAPESELEYFQQLRFLDPDILPFKNYYEYRIAWFRLTDGYSWSITPEGQEKLGKILSQWCFVVKREDIGLGGKKVYKRAFFALPGHAQKVYDQVNKKFLLETKKMKIGTIFATQKFLWLRKICSGIMDDLHDCKLRRLYRLLRTYGTPCIVWCAYTEELLAIEKALIAHGYSCIALYGKIPVSKRREAIDLFQNGNVDIFLAQPGCFKHGLDLSKAKAMIYFSTPLGLETRKQSEDRFVNLSHDHVLPVIDLIARDTIEEDIAASMQLKESHVAMLERIRKRYEKNR